MKKSNVKKEIFQEKYLSALQIKVKLADTQNIVCELGRGSGKTTNILASRLDRIINSMPGAIITIGAATYRDLFTNINHCMQVMMRDHFKALYSDNETNQSENFVF